MEHIILDEQKKPVGISFHWYVNDVLDQCNLLTEDEAMQVLRVCHDSHDANVGMNWEVIECAIEYLYPKKYEEFLNREEEE